jgi:D-alanine-D-alanine ligase
MGGPDGERPVSILSGRAVAAALRESGRWRVREEVIDRPSSTVLAAMGGDVVFPVLHGHWGEGGALQARLDESGVPYGGSRPDAAALAMHKLRTKAIVCDRGVATPPAVAVVDGGPCPLAAPLVLKPIDDGSSLDLAICRDEAAVIRARRSLHTRRHELMAERLIAGREITVGIVGGVALPLIEIVPAAGTYDYAAKYDRDDTRYVIDPALPEGVAETCRAWALESYRAVGARDLARVDFMVDERGPWFLEINTMPGFTTHSLVPMAAAATGRAMPALCDELAGAALARGRGDARVASEAVL